MHYSLEILVYALLVVMEDCIPTHCYFTAVITNYLIQVTGTLRSLGKVKSVNVDVTVDPLI